MFPSRSSTIKLSEQVDLNKIRLYFAFSVPFRYNIKEGYVNGMSYDSLMKEFLWKIYIKHRCKIEIFNPLSSLNNPENIKNIFDIPANSDVIIEIGPNLCFTKKEKESFNNNINNQIHDIFQSKMRLFFHALLHFETALYQTSQDFGKKTNGIINQLGIIKGAYGLISDIDIDIDKDIVQYLKHINYTSLDFIFTTSLYELDTNGVQLILNKGLYLFDLFFYKAACALGSGEKEITIVYLAMAVESAVFIIISPKLKRTKYNELSNRLGLSQMLELISEFYSLNDLQWKIIRKTKSFLNIRNKLLHVLERNKLTYLEEDLSDHMENVKEFLDLIHCFL